MRNRLVTAVLCVMMLSGFVLPLLVANTSDMLELTNPVDNLELSELSEVWYHDCTNLTGFTNITDSSWFYPFNSSDAIVEGDIGLGTSWIQANDVGSGSGWHGPVKAIPLSNPFKISELERFNARIGFDSSVGSQLGGIRVMLHDSNQRVICQFNIFDSWADDKQLKMPAHWAFLNGSATGTPWSEPDWVTFAPYDETLSILHNSTGFFAIIPEIGNFRLNVGPTDDLDRVVSYVSVWFAGYDGYSFCDSIRLHNISLEWTRQAVIAHPEDIAFETGMTGNKVTWTLSAKVGNPYIFYLDEGVLDSGTYNGQNISINTDSFSVGVHNLTVWGNTSYGIVQDTVWITVYPSTPPTIDSPPDVTYVVGETGNAIEWHPYDLYPASFMLYIDGAIEDSGDWNGSSILYNVDGYDVGVIEYVLYIFDLAGNSKSDLVMVHILPESDTLTIDHPPDILYTIGETGHSITWTPSSYYPAMYQLYVNNDLVNSGLWSGDQIVVGVDGLSPGIYNYTLRVFNTDEESVSDDVIVTVLGQTADDSLMIMSMIIGSIAVIIVVAGIVCQRKSG